MIDLTNEDNMELMKRYPDNYFELAIIDPPYGIGEDGGKKREGGQSRLKGLKAVNYKSKDWDKNTPKSDYFEELKRVSKNQIIWGGNYMVKHLEPSMGWVYWHKKGKDKSDFSDGELAYTSFKRALKFFKYDWIGFGYINNSQNQKKIHPTEKPIKLYEFLLMNYANEGDKILDTHLGSGSIALACHNLGFDLVGCELDKEYYDAACKRLKQHQAQLTIFD